jgi:hypothetical protein
MRGEHRNMTPSPFNPDTAPKITLSGKYRSATLGDMNKVALKLHEAGIQLYGCYKGRVPGDGVARPSHSRFGVVGTMLIPARS